MKVRSGHTFLRFTVFSIRDNFAPVKCGIDSPKKFCILKKSHFQKRNVIWLQNRFFGSGILNKNQDKRGGTMKACLHIFQKINRSVWARRLLRVFVGAAIGGVAGYLFYLFFGCTNGCTITSNPMWMTLYGMASGFLVACIPSERKGD